ncbi:unnamed protein product [Lactuca virosa]|uniref:Leucine-rich repeat-containing N-terminal plant-type domain-containing protein n=1 Tax=Lactuca virosa TaxID=75947 RepID=A0AAU9MCZ7_9ASTR|nr:unnamed protein product [Lactuca virosa]
MMKPFLGYENLGGFLLFIVYFLSVSIIFVQSQSSANDAVVMQALKSNLSPPKSLDWSDPNPCKWQQIQCSRDNRVTRIQAGNQNLKGYLPQTLNNLTELQVLEFQNNQLTGSLPSLAGLTQLQNLLLSYNSLTSIPTDFFDVFSATSANITGKIPDFFGGDAFAGLTTLHLSFNYLEGGLPSSFSGSSIQSLWLNGQNSRSKLNGTLQVLQNMTQLTEVWLHGNLFSGPVPEFSGTNSKF